MHSNFSLGIAFFVLSLSETIIDCNLSLKIEHVRHGRHVCFRVCYQLILKQLLGYFKHIHTSLQSLLAQSYKIYDDQNQNTAQKAGAPLTEYNKGWWYNASLAESPLYVGFDPYDYIDIALNNNWLCRWSGQLPSPNQIRRSLRPMDIDSI